MAANSKNNKLNSACLKIFALLSLLYEDKADYEAVRQIFKEDIDKSDNNIQVVLNKYINALKVFGIKIVKNKDKYNLESSLFASNYSIDDLKSINLLYRSCENYPNETVQGNVKNLIKNLECRMSKEDKARLNNICNNSNISFYYSGLREQIKLCEYACKQQYMVDVTYIRNKKEYHGIYIPKEVLFEYKMSYLRVYDEKKNEKTDIPLPNILSLHLLPKKSHPKELTTTVVYKIKNRLARTYKLKENEYSYGFDDDGNQTIVAKNEAFDQLLARLMRYAFDCEIITPKYLRDDMIRLINKTLENYNEK